MWLSCVDALRWLTRLFWSAAADSVDEALPRRDGEEGGARESAPPPQQQQQQQRRGLFGGILPRGRAHSGDDGASMPQQRRAWEPTPGTKYEEV